MQCLASPAEAKDLHIKFFILARTELHPVVLWNHPMCNPFDDTDWVDGPEGMGVGLGEFWKDCGSQVNSKAVVKAHGSAHVHLGAAFEYRIR